MSLLGWITLLVIAAVMFGRAALTARDEEPHVSLAQVISCVAYLALLLAGTLPLQLFWSTVGVLLFFFRPSAYQLERRRYYPEQLIPVLVVGTAAGEVLVWSIFQQIR